MPKVYSPESSVRKLGDSQTRNKTMNIDDYYFDNDDIMVNKIKLRTQLGVPIDKEISKNFDLGINEYLKKFKDITTNPKNIRIPYNNRWMKIEKPDTSKPLTKAMNIILLALISDFTVMMNAGLPHFWGYNFDKNDLIMTVSLDHAMYFHHNHTSTTEKSSTKINFDITDWILFELEAPITKNGRGYITGRFFEKSSGNLIASISQEVLFRSQPSKQKDTQNTDTIDMSSSIAKNLIFDKPFPTNFTPSSNHNPKPKL
ncbi:Acyl-coenzyme A thioesterase 8 [Smittium culicis]|uniref:Acyl-coenzyme A thioesterase 8 n=1 Tax=Smittium culicis TaxID=133412 RepID=A0A1R1YNT9_9FUNG|nr:Acyl-coenzyme A thioesterase 8 [Smittium culicis]